MKFRTPLVYAGFAALAIAAGLFTSWLVFQRHEQPRPQTEALLLHDSKPLPDFSLQDSDGQAFTKSSLLGHWSLLYFGYTHCPDACPTTLAGLAQVMKRLAHVPRLPKPTVYFISVDPKRDDLKLLKTYAAYFYPAFIGATGDEDALRALTVPLGVDYSYGKPDAKGDYTVDHSSFVMLVDRQGRQVAMFAPPLDAKQTAADYMNILKYDGESW
ncbi:MAG TPA: SCO family protein [Gammaproteobacteria bacterium]|jgi:protein SCO1/2